MAAKQKRKKLAIGGSHHSGADMECALTIKISASKLKKKFPPNPPPNHDEHNTQSSFSTYSQEKINEKRKLMVSHPESRPRQCLTYTGSNNTSLEVRPQLQMRICAIRYLQLIHISSIVTIHACSTAKQSPGSKCLNTKTQSGRTTPRFPAIQRL